MTEKVAKWSNDLRVSIRTGDISDMITYETQKEYLENMNKRGYTFYIVDASDDEAIGIKRLMRVNHIYRNAVLGVFIGDSSNRNSGIGTADDVMEAVEELELDEVHHGIASANSEFVLNWLSKHKIQLNVCRQVMLC